MKEIGLQVRAIVLGDQTSSVSVFSISLNKYREDHNTLTEQ